MASQSQLAVRLDALLQQGEQKHALRVLDSMRREALSGGDIASLQEVLAGARAVHARSEQRERNEAVRVMNAAQQNIRFLSRKLALAAGQEWVDPFASPATPGASEMVGSGSASPSDNEWLSSRLGTWAGLLVGTLAAAFAGGVVGVILGLVVWYSGGGITATYVLLVLPAVTACEYVGFVCGRWWAFTGSVSLVPWFLLGWAAGGDATFAAAALGCVTGSLAIGSLLSWAFNRRGSSRP